MIDKPTVIEYHAIPHPANPWLQICTVDDTTFITGTHYNDGELGVYIPDGWICPQNIIEDMELTGLLAGPEKNRVKRSKMRGIWSEGIFYGRSVDGEMSRNWNPEWKAGDSDNVIREWNLVKWENPEYVPPLDK